MGTSEYRLRECAEGQTQTPETIYAPQCAWPQPSPGQVRLPALPFPLDSKVEPFSGIPLVLPPGPAVGELESRLAGETTLMSRYLCTRP